jgi:hypothetical protein
MELFIRVKNGQPFEHPILGDNFRAAFPQVDVTNLPPAFARFDRIECPVVGVYQQYEGVTYEQDGDVFKDVHHIRDLTDAEKLSKQNAVKADWAINGFNSWIFNDVTCSFVPPVARPINGKLHQWDETTTSWIEIP